MGHRRQIDANRAHSKARNLALAKYAIKSPCSIATDLSRTAKKSVMQRQFEAGIVKEVYMDKQSTNRPPYPREQKPIPKPDVFKFTDWAAL